jgi:hypothetical protein
LYKNTQNKKTSQKFATTTLVLQQIIAQKHPEQKNFSKIGVRLVSWAACPIENLFKDFVLGNVQKENYVCKYII